MAETDDLKLQRNELTEGAEPATHDEVMARVYENKVAIIALQRDVKELTETLRPVVEFYTLMRSDIDTLGRFGRGLRSFLAWGAAIIISAGVLVAWAKNGLKITGGD